MAGRGGDSLRQTQRAGRVDSGGGRGGSARVGGREHSKSAPGRASDRTTNGTAVAATTRQPPAAQTPTPAEATGGFGLAATGVRVDDRASGARMGPHPPDEGMPGRRLPGTRPAVVDVRGQLAGVIQAATRQALDGYDYHEDHLQKPLAPAGYVGQMKELAEVIQQDIFTRNPGVRCDRCRQSPSLFLATWWTTFDRCRQSPSFFLATWWTTFRRTLLIDKPPHYAFISLAIMVPRFTHSIPLPVWHLPPLYTFNSLASMARFPYSLGIDIWCPLFLGQNTVLCLFQTRSWHHHS